jgi:cyanate permease
MSNQEMVVVGVLMQAWFYDTLQKHFPSSKLAGVCIGCMRWVKEPTMILLPLCIKHPARCSTVALLLVSLILFYARLLYAPATQQ